MFKGIKSVSLSTLLSRIFGFIRDISIAYFFGTSSHTDAFYIAFRIPNLFRRLFAEGALTIVFIPVYKEVKINHPEKEEDFLKGSFTIALISIGLFTLVGIVFAPYIVTLFAPGFLKSQEQFNLTTTLTRIMFPYIFFISLTAYFMGVLNTHHHFFAPAFAPVLLNISIIAAALLSTSITWKYKITILAIGVITGGVFQLLLQLIFTKRLKIPIGIKLYIDEHIKLIFKLLLPSIFGLAVYQLNLLFNSILASFLPSGSISYLYYTDRLVEFVLGIFIVSIATVSLPKLSEESARKDIESLKKTYKESINIGLLIAIPSSFGLFLEGKDIIQLLFQYGKFTAFSTEMTYKSLMFASFSIISVTLIRLTTPVFYSLKDTKTPVKIAFLSMIINVTSGYFLMKTPLLHAGLSLAYLISTTIQGFSLIWIVSKRLKGLNIIEKELIKILIAFIAMAIISYIFSKNIMREKLYIERFLGTTIISITVYFGMLIAIKSKSLKTLIKSFI